MTNLPEPARPRSPAIRPDLLRAAVSPTAAGLTAAGAGIGLLDHSVVLAVALAAVGWSARMAGALVGRSRRRRAARPHPPQLDPWSVPEPWRALVTQAASVQSRFDHLVGSWPGGPTRDRLVALQPEMWAQLEAVAVLAGRGAAADGWTGATLSPGGPTSAELSQELGRLQREKVRYAGTDRSTRAGQREAELAAQLRQARRREMVSQDLRDRVRAAVARLDAAVVELLTVEPGRSGPGLDVAGLVGSLDQLADGLSSLRLALTETTGTEPGAETPGPSM